jgi:universal stress protein A
MPKLSRILVPIDFSECSRVALDYATTLAKTFEAKIDVLHVWEVPPYIPPEAMVGVPGHDTQSLADVAKGSAEQEMRRFVKDLEDDGVHVERTLLDSGDPGRTIVDVAEKEGYDIIVLGTHGRTGLSHLLMGSVAERVVRHSSCPVLTVRSPGKSKR